MKKVSKAFDDIRILGSCINLQVSKKFCFYVYEFQITIFTFTTISPITLTNIQKRKYIKIRHLRNVSLVVNVVVKP